MKVFHIELYKTGNVRINVISRRVHVRFILYLINLLTAIGLTPGGSSTVHICIQTIRRTTQLTQTIRRTTKIIMIVIIIIIITKMYVCVYVYIYI